MHHQYVNREFHLMILAVLVTFCLSITTETPTTLVIFAGFMVLMGGVGWFYSKDLPATWIIRLVSTVMIVLGGTFLVWYFTIGNTLLRPIVDMRKIFESINESLVTPTP